MRPVNLIPADDRRDGRGPLRTGAIPYLIVGVLAAALLGVTVVVMTNNTITDRESEKASLEAQLAQTQEEAARLRSFTDFAAVQEVRQQTVSDLAKSRFDWERVLRELAIVIPDDVWLTALDASAAPGSSSSESTSSSSSGSSVAGTEGILGPSLSIHGCASGHDAVARFLAALRDIDGVTRVGVMSSSRPDTSTTGDTAASSGSGSSATCATRDFIATFEVVVAFDTATVAPTASTPTVPTAPTTPATTTPATDSSSTDAGAVTDADQQVQEQKDSAAEQTEKGSKAVSTFIPGTGSAP